MSYAEAILSHDEPMVEAGTLFVKLCATCLKQQHAIAINTAGTVMEPNFYMGYAKDAIEYGMFPILDLVFFGIYSNEVSVDKEYHRVLVNREELLSKELSPKVMICLNDISGCEMIYNLFAAANNTVVCRLTPKTFRIRT